MTSLLAAATFFVAIHFFISGSALRNTIVGSIGEGPFRGLFPSTENAKKLSAMPGIDSPLKPRTYLLWRSSKGATSCE
jgi:hypothetical protein